MVEIVGFRCSTFPVEQLTVLGMLMALISGLVGIFILVRLQQLFPLRFLRVLLEFLIWFNLLLAFGVAFRYLEFQPVEALSSRNTELLELLILELMALLKLMLLGSFLRTASLATGRPLAHRLRKIFRIVGVTWVVLLTVATLLPLVWETEGPALTVHSLFELFLLLGLLTTAVLHSFRASRLLQKDPRRAVLLFFAIHVAFFLLGFSFVLSSLIWAETRQWLQLATSLLMFLFNTSIAVWTYQNSSILQSVLETEGGGAHSPDAHFNRYGITPREGEVIELICRGRTNQEIADSLFISLQTVKDHAHSIFRKTGVTNRVQLARIFHDPEDAHEPRSEPLQQG